MYNTTRSLPHTADRDGFALLCAVGGSILVCVIVCVIVGVYAGDHPEPAEFRAPSAEEMARTHAADTARREKAQTANAYEWLTRNFDLTRGRTTSSKDYEREIDVFWRDDRDRDEQTTAINRVLALQGWRATIHRVSGERCLFCATRIG